MSYDPTTDFLGLLRQTQGGVRAESVPGLDYVLAALARMNQFQLSVGQTAPITDQAETVWLRPATLSWTAEGTVFLWNRNTAEYEPATPELWHALASAVTGHTQDVSVVAADILFDSRVVRVMNVGAAVDLVLPEAITKEGEVLVVDWANLAGTNNVRVHASGGDTFQNGLTTWTIAADSGSLCFRPVPGGYAV